MPSGSITASLRDVELILAARGIVVSYESIREWSLRFGWIFANALKRRRPQPGDKWYHGRGVHPEPRQATLSLAPVDQDGNFLDILVRSRRSATAAKRFFCKLLKGVWYVPRVIFTDKLKSYAAAKRNILPSVEHRQSRYLNNRAEVSHQPTRRRERQMKHLRSARDAQCNWIRTSALGQTANWLTTEPWSAVTRIADTNRPQHRFPADPAHYNSSSQRSNSTLGCASTAPKDCPE
jgi:transposase-like protein